MFWGRLPNLEDADGTGLYTHAADKLQQEEHDAHSQHVFFSYCML